MAKIVQSSSEGRKNLYEVIPLKAPFAVHIFPAYLCNFKCFYCIHSLEDEKLSSILKKQTMSIDTLKNAIDGIVFGEKLKVLNFAGHGEPLMNKNFADMVSYASGKNVADKIELVTNGYLLSHSLSRDIIGAGLTSLRISIQGTGAEKYKEISNVSIDFDRLLEQIAYFYENKKQCSVYIKIVDSALDGEDDSMRFFNLFEKYCDRIAIEHVVPTASGVSYDSVQYETTQQGFDAQKVISCPSPFYMLVVEPDGCLRPCCATEFPVALGNVNDSKISDIWQSNKLNCFQLMQLEGKRHLHKVCGCCTIPDFGLQPGDNIDSHRKELIPRIQRVSQ